MTRATPGVPRLVLLNVSFGVRPTIFNRTKVSRAPGPRWKSGYTLSRVRATGRSLRIMRTNRRVAGPVAVPETRNGVVRPWRRRLGFAGLAAFGFAAIIRHTLRADHPEHAQVLATDGDDRLVFLQRVLLAIN